MFKLNKDFRTKIRKTLKKEDLAEKEINEIQDRVNLNLKTTIQVDNKAVSERGLPIISGVITSESLDLTSESIDLSTIDVTVFEENGCLLFNHDDSIVIGKLLGIYQTPQEIRADFEVFTDLNSQIDIAELYEKTIRGAITGFSIGFIPEYASPMRDENQDIVGTKLSGVRILETSLVAIPCNPTARIEEVEQTNVNLKALEVEERESIIKDILKSNINSK